MTKAEADVIVKACNKHQIFASISKVVDDYSVRLVNRIEFNSFDAVKLAVNALVIEGRLKKTEVVEKKTDENTDFLKQYHNFHKNRKKPEGNWGENRAKS